MNKKYVPVDTLVSHALDKKKSKSLTCFTSGILHNGVFFHTISLEYEGSYYPVVVTSMGNVLEVHVTTIQYNSIVLYCTICLFVCCFWRISEYG